MTYCPKCNSAHPADFTHCPKDGTILVHSKAWAQGSIVREKYQIMEPIGEGGMATVYRARHVHFREFRALKVINPDLASDESFVKRFIQEAIVTRQLQHPNIVRIDDIERAEDGRPFIVMELVEGTLLKDAMKNGPLPVKTVISIVRQVAGALGAAHQLGMVHRDIKPGNIIIEEGVNGNNVKVLDFGIARIRESQLEDSRIPSTQLTSTGAIVGTPAYMSPEQAMGKRGNQIDGRSDLYSLGMMAYHMLTGCFPLSADSDLELMLAQIKTEPTPIRNLRPDLPEPLCAAIMACLAKDPNSRPQTCAAFIAALDGVKVQTQPSSEERPAPKANPASVNSSNPTQLKVRPRAPRKLILSFSGLAIAAVAVTAIIFSHKPQPSPQPAPQIVAPQPSQTSASPTQTSPPDPAQIPHETAKTDKQPESVIKDTAAGNTVDLDSPVATTPPPAANSSDVVFNSGVRFKASGVILSRDGRTVRVRFPDGSNGSFVIGDATKIFVRTGIVLRRKREMDAAALVPGLQVEVQGIGGQNGELRAESITLHPNSSKSPARSEVSLDR